MDDERLKNIERIVTAIHECLYGNSNPGDGLTDRVSKIEVQLNLYVKWGMRIGGAIIAILLTLLGIKEILTAVL